MILTAAYALSMCTHIKSYILIFNKAFALKNLILMYRMRSSKRGSENDIFNPRSKIDASRGVDDKDASRIS